MINKKLMGIFALIISTAFFLTVAANCNGEILNLTFYYGNKTEIVRVNADNITDAEKENPKIIEGLQKLENPKELDISKGVWGVSVPYMPKGAYYKSPGVQFSFGSCVAIDPEDPAFNMSEFDQDQMKNYGIAKKNYDKDATYFDTNFHVVSGWDKDNGLPIQIKKIFRNDNGRNVVVTYNTELIGVAPREDLAVLKVTGKKFTTLQIGDLSKISDYQKAWGYSAMALGSPYAFEGTLSLEGKVFYPAKDLNNYFTQLFGVVVDSPLNGVRYQMNVMIHPGNSGGLLFGLSGENKNKVIGKPCSGYPGSSINFAIPDFTLREILPQLISGKLHTPCYSGLALADPTTAMDDKINTEFFKQFGLKSVFHQIKNTPGALVVGFMDDSPFKTKKAINPFYENTVPQDQQDEEDSIHYGDIITKVGGAYTGSREVKNPHDFLDILRKITDSKVSVEIVRFVETKDAKSELKFWEAKKILIIKKKEDLTISDKKYRSIYQSIKNNEFNLSVIMSAGEIRGERINFKTDLMLK